MDLKTMRDWSCAGYSVIPGEHAASFLVAPDQTRAEALFRDDQVQPMPRPDRSWIEMPAADWQAIRQARKDAAKPKRVIRVRSVGQDTMTQPTGLKIWVGANKQLIKQLKLGRFVFDPGSRRWMSTQRTDVGEWVDRLHAAHDTGKYNVIWE